MSFSDADVRAHLVAMGYSNVPDHVISQFASRLAAHALQRRPQPSAATPTPPHRQLPTAPLHHHGEERSRASHPRPPPRSPASSVSSTSEEDDDGLDSSPQAERVAPALSAWKASAPVERRRGAAGATYRSPPKPSHPSRRSPPRPLPATNRVQRPARHPPAPPSRLTQPPALRSCEEQREEEEDVESEDERSDSDKENVEQLLLIQRGLARVLQERGIVSPFKSPPLAALSYPPPHLRSPQSLFHPRPTVSHPSSSSSSPSSSSSSSPSTSSTVPRPSSSMSRRSSLSTSSSSWSGSRSAMSAAPLVSARTLALRQAERVQGMERGYGEGGFKKTDVVSRYCQYKLEWERSRFLQRKRL